MYKKAKLLSLSLFTILALWLVSYSSVLAAGTTSLSMSKNSPNAGETFTVDINASSSADITLSYNSEILTMIGSTVDGRTGNNSFTFTGSKAQLTFKATAPGKSGLVVKSPSLTGCSVNIEVGGTAPQDNSTNTDEESNTSSATNDSESETNESEEAVLSDEPINHISIENKSIELLISEPSNIPLPSFVMGECKSSQGTFMGYQIEGGDENIYYVYGTNEFGEDGWYMYDTLTETLSRADIDGLVTLDSVNKDIMLAEASEPVDDDGMISIDKRFIIAAGIFLLAIIIIIIINAALRSRANRLDDLEEDDYYDDIDDNVDNTDDYDTESNDEDVVNDTPLESTADETQDLDYYEEADEEKDDTPSELDKILDEQEAAVRKHKESIDLLDLNDL